MKLSFPKLFAAAAALFFVCSLHAQRDRSFEPRFNYSLLKELVQPGKVDKYGQRTGVWTEFFVDSSNLKESIDRHDAHGNPSPPNEVILVRAIGKYVRGKREGLWKFYKTYDNYQPLRWTLIESITFRSDYKEGPWKYYYDTGKVMSEARYRSNMLQGKFTQHFPDGKIEQTWTYDRGRLNGITKQYSRYGELIWSGNYYEDMLHGESKAYYYNGQLLFTTIYNMGVPWSRVNAFSRDGKPIDKGTLHDGTGILTDYNRGGALVITSEYVNGLKNGWRRTYHLNGKLHTEVEWRNDSMIGKYREYNFDGSLYFEGQVHDGYFTGLCKTYYPSGRLKSENNYHEGSVYETGGAYGMNGEKLDGGNMKDGAGTWIEYDDSARISTKWTYKDYVLTGVSETYHTNGKVATRYAYKDGLLNGAAEEYREDGSLLAKFYYENGLLEGKAVGYHRDGKIYREQYFYHDRLWHVLGAYDSLGNKLNSGDFRSGNGTLLGYDYAGHLTSREEMLYGLAHGSSIRYYRNGNKRHEYTVWMGEIRGLNRTYWPNGALSVEWTQYENGRTGKMTQWHDNGQLWVIWHFEEGFMWRAEFSKDRNGKDVDKGTFDNGNGTLLRYNEQGELIYTGHFLYGYCYDCELDRDSLYDEDE